MKKLILLVILVSVVIAGYGNYAKISIPVMGASHSDYNKESFWFYPWGKSVVHKGVDVFAKKGTKVVAASGGFVLYTGYISAGGNVVVQLDYNFRLHYYAHLDQITIDKFSFVGQDSPIGTVGNSGNAANTPAHLHYSIATLLLNPFRIDDSIQGYRKAFYLNPIELFRK